MQAGILDQRDGDETVTTAIAADPTLSERQRTTLLQIYAAFQAENRAQAEREQQDLEAEPGPDSPNPMDEREDAR